jgi:23S rRNA (adenine1618-N6)-methyltransferase
VQWYSSMFGKLSSATGLITVLQEKGITNYAVTCLQAGNVTKRWGVAWSFGDLRPDDVGLDI